MANSLNLRWVRSRDGVFFGVCKGVARAMDLSVGMVRLLWLVCVLFGGVGLGAYLLLAFSLPREDKVSEALQPKFLGVCAKISKRTNLEVGVVRFLTLALLFASLGLTAILYFVGYFFISDQPESVASRNNPSSPPSTT